MNYEEVMAYLYSQLPMYQRVGKTAFKKDLSNTIALCEHLGNPHTKFHSIHVAGTNGKGSVSHMIASALQENGLKVGLYTSPHLKDYRERVRINGKMIPEQKVVEFVESNKKAFDGIKPSFFEWNVALAFHHFAEESVDIAVLETGMGGRLDSTNVVTPILSVITNIGTDHSEHLGDSLDKIAYEKAGIIKREVPVVIGKTQPETTPVFVDAAKRMNSTIVFAEDLELEDTLDSDLVGSYQPENIKTAFVALHTLKYYNFYINLDKAREGLRKVKQNTGLRGRWEVLQESPKVVCDVAHNAEGVAHVMNMIREEQYNNLHIVWGSVKDKDQGKLLKLLPAKATYYFCAAKIPRALDAKELAGQASKFNLNGVVFESVAEAYRAALNAASKDDLVFVGGSTFVVAEVL